MPDLPIDWVAVKEVELSYHNAYMYGKQYGFPNIVT